MNEADDLQYEDWVRLANDPRESEEMRALFRARMEQYVHERLRRAFQAIRQPPNPKDS